MKCRKSKSKNLICFSLHWFSSLVTLICIQRRPSLAQCLGFIFFAIHFANPKSLFFLSLAMHRLHPILNVECWGKSVRMLYRSWTGMATNRENHFQMHFKPNWVWKDGLVKEGRSKIKLVLICQHPRFISFFLLWIDSMTVKSNRIRNMRKRGWSDWLQSKH